jgi:glutathione S-transferase
MERARTLQWMFFEQYSHEPYIAVARFWKHFFPKLTPQQELELPNRMKGGYAALGVMEQHLARHPFFVADRYGLADIALYAYTHVAQEGGFLLDEFPHVTSWLSRVAVQPGYVSIDHKF